MGLSLSLTISLTPAYSASPPKTGSVCSNLGISKTYQGKKYTCIKNGKKLVWSKGVVIKIAAPVATPSPTQTNSPSPIPKPIPSPSPTPTSQIALPKENTPCEKIGTKVFGNGGYMKCLWMGGPNAEAISKQIYWRFFDIPKLSNSQSNNYPVTPLENATCTTSGDSYSVAGGILECRWISGKKLQWIKINDVKKPFQNAKSPVSLDVCKIQMSDAKVVRTGRDAGGGQIGFPMANTTKNGMNPKGTNEILIIPIDFPDFTGTVSPIPQLQYDSKWLIEWYNYFSNGQAKFNVTTIDKWFRMSKPRSGYPTDGKTTSSLEVDANGINGR